MIKKDKNILITIVAIIIVVIIIVVAIMINNNKQATTANMKINNVEELTNLLNKIYDNTSEDLYNVETKEIDLSDSASVKTFTGLESGQNFEFAIVSEPLISAQAYSVVMAKVKDGINANEIAKEMSEKIDMRKWICVSADKLFATNSGNIVFLVMTNEEMANSVYKSFKNLAGTVGQEYEKNNQESELSEDAIIPMPQ